jgi:hypothetical protein
MEMIMNERIQTLALQCGAWHQVYDQKRFMVDGNFDAAKFAELIVEECVAICQDVDGEDNIDARSGRQDCAVEIREHFGVEE